MLELAVKQRRGRTSTTYREREKEVFAPGIKGLTELLGIQVDPVNSFKSTTEIQTELTDLTGAEEGSRGRALPGLTCT